jgi:hypothetical protein
MFMPGRRNIVKGVCFIAAGVFFVNVVDLDYNWRHLPAQETGEGLSVVHADTIVLYILSPVGGALVLINVLLFLLGALFLGWRPWPFRRLLDRMLGHD